MAAWKSGYGARYYAANAEQLKARQRAFRVRDPERFLEIQRRSKFKKKYGLTLEEFEKMRAEQDNKCAICRLDFASTPRVDHDHRSGVVRGLLCDPCNRGLGAFRDDPDRCRYAAEYLDTSKNRR